MHSLSVLLGVEYKHKITQVGIWIHWWRPSCRTSSSTLRNSQGRSCCRCRSRQTSATWSASSSRWACSLSSQWRRSRLMASVLSCSSTWAHSSSSASIVHNCTMWFIVTWRVAIRARRRGWRRLWRTLRMGSWGRSTVRGIPSEEWCEWSLWF